MLCFALLSASNFPMFFQTTFESVKNYHANHEKIHVNCSTHGYAGEGEKTPRIFAWKLFIANLRKIPERCTHTPCTLWLNNVPPFQTACETIPAFCQTKDKALELVTFFVIVIAIEYIVNSKQGERMKKIIAKNYYSRETTNLAQINFKRKNIVNFHSPIYWNYVCTRNNWSKKRELIFEKHFK